MNETNNKKTQPMPSEGLSEKRLASYGAMALAMAVGAAAPTEAGIISYSIGEDVDNGPLSFNMVSGGIGSHFKLNHATSFRPMTSSSSGFTSARVRISPGGLAGGHVLTSSGYAAMLALNAGIGPLAGTFLGNATLGSSSYGMKFGNWRPGNSGYLGLRFLLGEPGSETTHYGWAYITLGAKYQPTLVSVGYESCADEGILAGATTGGATCADSGGDVPEPHSAALVALGAAGLLAWRRRQKARKAA